jgi:hypothetical protein
MRISIDANGLSAKVTQHPDGVHLIFFNYCYENVGSVVLDVGEAECLRTRLTEIIQEIRADEDRALTNAR